MRASGRIVAAVRVMRTLSRQQHFKLQDNELIETPHFVHGRECRLENCTVDMLEPRQLHLAQAAKSVAACGANCQSMKR